MNIIYRAFDGKEFESRDDCAEYEASIQKVPTMLNFAGHRTNDYEEAWYVKIEEDNEAKWFRNKILNDRKYNDEIFIQDLEYDNSPDFLKGIWYWNEDLSRYDVVDELTIKNIAKLMGLAEI